MLMKGMEYWESSYEKAPSIVISHKKPSSRPRLETIIEEGSELNSEVGHMNLFFVLIPLSLSLSLSIVSYVLSYRNIV
ncbi:hypothetical protein V6N13_015666 [Hibiscus sabdariffa]|uniref:Transmembrane protein n=1 Tax=Hibiscus sabdariffa TaxID=183260 RepID=A0ABR2CZ07_9ROSI